MYRLPRSWSCRSTGIRTSPFEAAAPIIEPLTATRCTNAYNFGCAFRRGGACCEAAFGAWDRLMVIPGSFRPPVSLAWLRHRLHLAAERMDLSAGMPHVLRAHATASRDQRDIAERLHERSLQFPVHTAQDFVGILTGYGRTVRPRFNKRGKDIRNCQQPHHIGNL